VAGEGCAHRVLGERALWAFGEIALLVVLLGDDQLLVAAGPAVEMHDDALPLGGVGDEGEEMAGVVGIEDEILGRGGERVVRSVWGRLARREVGGIR
jgi:hypothetical protein